MVSSPSSETSCKTASYGVPSAQKINGGGIFEVGGGIFGSG